MRSFPPKECTGEGTISENCFPREYTGEEPNRENSPLKSTEMVTLCVNDRYTDIYVLGGIAIET